ncbi:hypothetical protein ACLB2K_012153 [Fragaria x ananassa]
MLKALRIYAEALRLVRRLPKDSRPYYAKYLRENFVNYREVEVNDDQALHDLFNRAYLHSLWVLNKYSVDESAADKLKKICTDKKNCNPKPQIGNCGGLSAKKLQVCSGMFWTCSLLFALGVIVAAMLLISRQLMCITVTRDLVEIVGIIIRKLYVFSNLHYTAVPPELIYS